MTLIEALEILKAENATGDECPKCGAFSIDRFVEETGTPEGIDEDEWEEFIDKKIEEFMPASFTPANKQANEGAFCSACGWDEWEEAREAQIVVGGAYDNAVERVVDLIEGFGGNVTLQSSGISEAHYIEFYDADGNERKIRIAAHIAKPTYMKMHGPADFEAVVCPECLHMDADGDIDDLLKWIQKVGVEEEDE